MSRDPAGVTRWRSFSGVSFVFVCLLLLILPDAGNAQPVRADVDLRPIGGPGGAEFRGRCGVNELLTGIDIWRGDWVDAVRPICIPVKAGKFKEHPNKYGGPSGTVRQLVCPNDRPIVTGISVYSQGEDTESVHEIGLYCGIATLAMQNVDYGKEPTVHASTTYRLTEIEHRTYDWQACPPGMVAVGITGRSGIWLDAFGTICGDPREITAVGATPEREPETVVKAQGRVRLDPGAPASSPSTPRAICDLARQARARNSPAAPGLEAQCRAAGAAGEVPPVRAQGRVRLSAPTDAPTGPPRQICDLARQARARNSPAAPGLEEKCRADLAGAGAAIARADAIVAEARAAQMDAVARQGFDIATAIFGDPALGGYGNTGTGPVSLGMRDQLTPAGKRGFDDSVKLHLSRDYGPAEAAPKITANPNPVLVPNGQYAGTTTITWTAAPAYTYSEIYLSINNGEWSEFARGGDGSRPTTIKPGTSQTFRMMVYEGQAGTPKIIASLTVTAR